LYSFSSRQFLGFSNQRRWYGELHSVHRIGEKYRVTVEEEEEKGLIEVLRLTERIILKMIFPDPYSQSSVPLMGNCRQSSSGSGFARMVGCCELRD
jgi:hypothetical protein